MPTLAFFVDDDDFHLVTDFRHRVKLFGRDPTLAFVTNINKHILVVYLDNSTGYELAVFNSIKRFKILLLQSLLHQVSLFI